MGAVAGLRAIRTAGLEPDDIDVIILATLTPDYWMPSTAALVKEAIGNTQRLRVRRHGGLLRASSTATRPRAPTSPPGWRKHVLVIGAELLTRFLDYTDRSTCILFGDGAGAVVLSASDEPTAPVGHRAHDRAAGRVHDLAAGRRRRRARRRPRRSPAASTRSGWRVAETYRFATRTLASTALAAVGKAGIGAGRRRPVHPAPGEHPDHRGGGQGPRTCRWSGCSSTSTGTGTPRPRRCRSPSPRPSTRAGWSVGDKHRVGRVRGRVHVRRRGHGVDRRPGARPRRRRRRPARGRDRPAPGRLGLGRPDPAGPRRDRRAGHRARRRGRRSTTSSRASRSPPTSPSADHRPRPRRRPPGAAPSHRRSTDDRPLGQDRARDRAARAASARRSCCGSPRQGADVAFSFRGNQAAADATVAEVEALGRRALAVQMDARDAEAAEALVKAVLEAFGKIDILVNNAGITRDDLIMRMSLENWTRRARDEPVRRVLRAQGRAPGRCSRRAAGGSSTSPACRARRARWARRTTAPRRPG